MTSIERASSPTHPSLVTVAPQPDNFSSFDSHGIVAQKKPNIRIAKLGENNFHFYWAPKSEVHSAFSHLVCGWLRKLMWRTAFFIRGESVLCVFATAAKPHPFVWSGKHPTRQYATMDEWLCIAFAYAPNTHSHKSHFSWLALLANPFAFHCTVHRLRTGDSILADANANDGPVDVYAG